MGCHHINSAYLCERHGVMRRELNSTCLGSLYVQDFAGATQQCEMKIVEQTETVLQLHFSLRLDSVIKHYKWDLDEIAFSSEERTVSSRWLEILGMENVGRTTLNSIWQDLAIEQRSTSWLFIFSIIGALVAAILAIIAFYGLATRTIVTLKTRILNILLRTLPEPVMRMIQPPQQASAPNQQPLLEPVQWWVVPRQLSNSVGNLLPKVTWSKTALAQSFMPGGIMENVWQVVAPIAVRCIYKNIFIFMYLFYSTSPLK